MHRGHVPYKTTCRFSRVPAVWRYSGPFKRETLRTARPPDRNLNLTSEDRAIAHGPLSTQYSEATVSLSAPLRLLPTNPIRSRDPRHCSGNRVPPEIGWTSADRRGLEIFFFKQKTAYEITV